MPLITKQAIERQQLRREPGLWDTVVALADRVLGESVLIEHTNLLVAFSRHPRLMVQPVSNKVLVPGAAFRPGIGDRLEKLAKPVARALKMPCLDAAGALKPTSGCAKRRNWLNAMERTIRGKIGL